MKPGPQGKLLEDLWSFVAINGQDECWPFEGFCNPYGRFYADGKSYSAHRLALVLTSGKDPGKKNLACHTCDNPPCCNPKHLYWGTHSTNGKDAYARNKRVSTAKLTRKEVLEIFEYREGGCSLRELAEMFNCSDTNIQYILSGETWKGVMPNEDQDLSNK